MDPSRPARIAAFWRTAASPEGSAARRRAARPLATLLAFALGTACARAHEEAAAAGAQPASGRLQSVQESYLRDVLRQFGSPDPRLRRQAVLDVARAGDAAVPLVVESAGNTSNPLVQRCCLFALAEVGGATAAAAVRARYLADALREDERAIAALILGKLGPAEAREQLREEAASRRPGLLRQAAVLALGRVGDADGLAPVLASLSREPLQDRRVALLLAAGATADRVFLPVIVPLLEDGAAPERMAAAFAAGEVADAAALPDLLRACRREKDEKVLESFALALGVFEDPASCEVLEEWTRSRAEGVKAAALAALAARADGAGAVVQVFAASRDASLLERTALAAAGAPEPRLLRQALEGLLLAQRANVRAAAGLALAALGAEEALQPLLDWLRSEKDQVALRDALLVAGALEFEGALPLAEERRADAGDEQLCLQVERTLSGRRDARHLRDRLEARLAATGARLHDRRDLQLSELVGQALGLDDYVRRRAVAPGDPPGGGGGEGGGDEGGEGAEGEGQEGFPGRRPGRVDLRGSAVERDIEEWLADEAYFPPAAARRARR
ncbi:MAG: HEAT repeat domain-containing protein [Planctomycetes bacterium]|nr:HEAT repeat domain-containing protein [Planctomycetota bacterium]